MVSLLIASNAAIKFLVI